MATPSRKMTSSCLQVSLQPLRRVAAHRIGPTDTPAEDLSEEDQQLKGELDMLVERLQACSICPTAPVT